MLKFLIILFVCIYLIARFAGYFFRFAFWLFGKQIEKKVREQQQASYRADQPKPEGTVEIINPSHGQPAHSNHVGEYVSFEEVK